MKYFLFLIGYFFVIPAYADVAAIDPSPEMVKLCVEAFNGSKFLVLELFFILGLLILSVSLLRWIIKKRIEKINIVLFICTFVFFITPFVLTIEMKPTACLGNKDCEKEFSEQIHDWCSEMLYNYVNDRWCGFCHRHWLHDFDPKETEDCKKCMAAHWQYKVFKKFDK